MKTNKIMDLIERHERSGEITDVDNLREYLIYGEDNQKVIAKPTGCFHGLNPQSKDFSHMECVVGQDMINIPLDEIRHMELVVKFSDLPSECCVIDPNYVIENVFGQNDEDYEMPITLVKLGVKGYFKVNLGVKSEKELMKLNMLRYGVKYQEVVDIMLDQSMFNADADHIIKHKYDAKLRLPKSEREAI
jgi:hypothetical protein|tara:strand:+ start:665 stop:1234 length:570 start_codon:yes stop_codon:yes gene_type:complete